MTSCGECEDGSCPCGGGCPACCFTGQCGKCHGTGRTIARHYVNTRADKIRIKEST